MRVRLDGDYSAKVGWAVTEVAEAFSGAGLSAELVDLSEGVADLGDYELFAGTAERSAVIRDLQLSGALKLSADPESLAIRRVNGALVVAGSDEQGLMYGLLEVADQFKALEPGASTLDLVSETCESPDTAFRGLFTFLHNADCEREWFYSREHWEAYFSLLARSRYNSFHIVMAHQTAYLAPPFPFFVDVPEHPEVVVPGLTDEQRKENLSALNMIAGLAANRGLEFVVGIWEVIAWKPETYHAEHTQRSMVDGLDWENLESYTYHAARSLLSQCPGIRGLQVRVNAESGIPAEKQAAFFTNTIFRALKEAAGRRFLDLRGWIALPETIQAARSMGIPMRLSMKYWAEHLGAPYQAAEQQPAYSYADFLRYPRQCPISYQVWALGSHRHFVWGDPDYVRTFCRSLKLGGGTGFEICPPLAQKGYGNEPGAWRILHRQHEYYEWEWERYWLYHRLFGRLTYNQDAASEAWMRELRRRFGGLADLVMGAYAAASKVVSFIIRFNLSDPNMYIWPEADTGGILEFYIGALPSDPAVIESFAEAAEEQMTGAATARVGPREASAYLREIGEKCLDAVASIRSHFEAEAHTDHDAHTRMDGCAEKELLSTLVDVEALGELALYHAEKSLAGFALSLYRAGGGSWPLREITERIRRSTQHWERLAAVTDGVYTDKQITGPVDSGHWKDKLILVREDEERVNELIEIDESYGGAVRAFDFGGVPELPWFYSRLRSMHSFHVEWGFIGVGAEKQWGTGDQGFSYGWTGTEALRSAAAPPARFCDIHTDDFLRDIMKPTGFEKLTPLCNELYRDYVGGDRRAVFATGLPAGLYEVIVVCCDRSTSAQRHGPFSISINGEELASGVVAQPREHRELRKVVAVTKDRLAVSFLPEEGGDWFVSALVVRSLTPVISHVPVWTAVRREESLLRVSVSCPEQVDEVTIHLRPMSGGRREEPTAIPMKVVESGRLYEIPIDPGKLLPSEPSEPGEHSGPGRHPELSEACEGSPIAGTIEYWFSAKSVSGHVGRLMGPVGPAGDAHSSGFPGSSGRFSLTVVGPGLAGPAIEHVPTVAAYAGQAIEVIARVRSEAGVRSVRLHYRCVNQYYEWQVVEMECHGGLMVSEIPAGYVVKEWDLMYYIEAADNAGQTAFAPTPDPVRDIPYWVITVNR